MRFQLVLYVPSVLLTIIPLFIHLLKYCFESHKVLVTLLKHLSFQSFNLSFEEILSQIRQVYFQKLTMIFDLGVSPLDCLLALFN